MAGLGYIFLESILNMMVETTSDNPTAKADHMELRSLVKKNFPKDVKEGLRSYLQGEMAWRRAVQFLDKDGGWAVLEAMLRSKDFMSDDDPYSLCPSLEASSFLKM